MDKPWIVGHQLSAEEEADGCISSVRKSFKKESGARAYANNAAKKHGCDFFVAKVVGVVKFVRSTNFQKT